MLPPRSSTGYLALCVAVGGLSVACGDVVEKVSTDVCVSGLRWVGENTRDEEMLPGTDCVGCHLENDGPELLAGGTVYAVDDNTSQIENDCFGLEGVTVEIEAANGALWTTTTNRAGNFYFDGTAASLAKPYTARFRYTTPEGHEVVPQMIVTQPSYGGCARCHDNRAAFTPDLEPNDPRFVRPVQGLFVR